MRTTDAIEYRPLWGLPSSSFVKKLQIALLVFGAIALGYTGFVLVNAAIYQSITMRQFEEEKNVVRSTADSTVHPPGVIRRATSPGKMLVQPVVEGTPLARLEIHRLHLDAIVVEGDNNKDLDHAIGHIPATALPGDPGNIGIAGHRDTFFRPLRNIRTGDIITLTTAQGSHRYVVEQADIVSPEDSEVLRATSHPTLTLVTCYPFTYFGSAPERFIVHASEIITPP